MGAMADVSRAQRKLFMHSAHPTIGVSNGFVVSRAWPAKPDPLPAQGLRVLKACSSRDLEHVAIVPTTSTAFHGNAISPEMLLWQRFSIPQ